jgi:hypothetical protein
LGEEDNMKKFRIYAKSITYYTTEVEVESAEEIVFDDIDMRDFEELDEIAWVIDDVVEVEHD